MMAVVRLGAGTFGFAEEVLAADEVPDGEGGGGIGDKEVLGVFSGEGSVLEEPR